MKSSPIFINENAKQYRNMNSNHMKSPNSNIIKSPITNFKSSNFKNFSDNKYYPKTTNSPFVNNSSKAQNCFISKLSFNNEAEKSENNAREFFESKTSNKNPKRNSINSFMNSSKKFSFQKKLSFDNCQYSSSPKQMQSQCLEDRFIPCNDREKLIERFELERIKDEDNYRVKSKEFNPKQYKDSKGIKEFNETYDLNKIQENEEKSEEENINQENKLTYMNLLEHNLFGTNSTQNYSESIFDEDGCIQKGRIKSRILKFRPENVEIPNENEQLFENLYTSMNNLGISAKPDDNFRKFNSKPYKTIEVPKILDDFYLNLLDWSTKNEVAVGLDNTLCIYITGKNKRYNLFNYTEKDKYISSLIWNQEGTDIAVGNSEGMVEIWDVQKEKLKQTLHGHTARVGVVAWHNNNLSSGSKDHTINNHDLRAKEKITKFSGHKQEVCGLKWSFDGSHLASGGNDNKLMIWSLNQTTPIMKSSNHEAAVKAIAWSPHQHNLLASGGGTADKCIRFWDTNTLQQINCVETGSQVCNLVFSKNVNELVSTHGYSLNQINIWKLPDMKKMTTLTGHTYRVLYLSLSPNGQNIVTGAGDETLRFWSVFPSNAETNKSSIFSMDAMKLR